ncbi:thioesterase family protein [Cryptosporangium japonicum]|uniref:Thioesterase family protein n=1 Tax=Cryptosporangium japonicum TaxID=80872 RepID=A0ABP3ER72_9ACTN
MGDVLEIHTEIRETGPDRYATLIDGGWAIGSSLNGGYLQLPVVRAVLAAEGHPHPVAVTTDYLQAPHAGEAEIVVERLRTGKTIGTSRATLIQDGQPCLVSSVVTSTLDSSSPDLDMAPQIELPSPDQCTRIRSDVMPGTNLALMDHVDVRLAPEFANVVRGRPDGSMALRGWVRMVDGRDPDPLVCLLAADAFPPVTFTIGRYGWAPTVQLTTYLRVLPAPGWLRCELRGRVLANGWFDEDCTIRDSAGRLVAQSRQIARIPRVPTPTEN